MIKKPHPSKYFSLPTYTVLKEECSKTLLRSLSLSCHTPPLFSQNISFRREDSLATIPAPNGNPTDHWRSKRREKLAEGRILILPPLVQRTELAIVDAE
jgi:hypothetical protein